MNGRSDSKPIDLRRITAPHVPAHRAAFATALRGLAGQAALDELTHAHRQLGTAADRAAAAAWLSTRLGSDLRPDCCVVTNGTLGALALLIEDRVPRGGVLLVEELCYAHAGRIAAAFGRRVEAVAMDREGCVPEALDRACAAHAARALFCVPSVQNPTAAVMSLARRRALVAIARKHDLAIIEDDAQGLFPDEAPPPLSTLVPERSWYVMGLSKCLALGLRLAFTACPTAQAADRLREAARNLTLCHCHALSAAVATQWIETGQATALHAAVRAEARQRWRIAMESLAKAGVSPPARHYPSLHLWLPVPSLEAECSAFEALTTQGVLMRRGVEFASRTLTTAFGLRLSLSDAAHDQLEQAMGRVATAINGSRLVTDHEQAS